MTRTNTQKSHAAYKRCEAARRHLADLSNHNGKARYIEYLQDKDGIFAERWLVGKTNVVLYSTPDWWNVYIAYDGDNTVKDTLAYLTRLAEQELT